MSENLPSITLPNGHNLSWRDNKSGGRTYYSDETSGGIRVWDTHYVDISTLLAAITQEMALNTNKSREEFKETIRELEIEHKKHKKHDT
jgi:hypothetical protein